MGVAGRCGGLARARPGAGDGHASTTGSWSSQALARLPARQREVLLLRYYEDLTEAEIAVRLGLCPRHGEELGGPGPAGPAGHAPRVLRHGAPRLALPAGGAAADESLRSA